MASNRIHHVAVVVEDIQASLHFWRDGLGLELSRLEDVQEQASQVAFLPVGDADIELVRPTTADSGVARYLAKRGPGMHHLCFEVDDLPASLRRLGQLGFRLIDPEPVTGPDGRRYAFIHPESTGGVLIELYQAPLRP